VLEKFIKKFGNDVEKLKKITTTLEKKEKARKISIFYNAYNSYKLNKATKLLAIATIILAVSSFFMLLINYFSADKIIQITIYQIAVIAVKFGLLILIIKLILAVIISIFDWIENKIKSFIIKRLKKSETSRK